MRANRLGKHGVYASRHAQDGMCTDIQSEDKQSDGTYQCRPIDALAEAAVDQCIEERLFGRRTEHSVAHSTRKSGKAIQAKPDEDGD